MEGMLVWYWETQYSDNDVGDHPGHGELVQRRRAEDRDPDQGDRRGPQGQWLNVEVNPRR